VALIAGLVLLPACGSDEKPSTTERSGSDAASAVDCEPYLDAVTKALPAGTNPSVVGDVGSNENFTACGYAWQKFKQGTSQIYVYEGTGSIVADADYAPADGAKLRNGEPYVPVDGLGEKAWAFGGERGVSLFVLQGADAVNVDITQFPPEQNIAPRIDEWKGDALTAAKSIATSVLNGLS
jgi:hypothetical protein